jgi:tRNA pseudouridine55 synthase
MSLAEAVRRALPIATLSDAGAAKARLGQKLSLEHFVEAPTHAQVTAWLDPDGALVALGEQRDEVFRVVRGFSAP